MARDRASETLHRVQSLRFQFEGRDEAGLLRLRAQLEALCEGELREVLSDLFDGLAGPDELVEIPRLDVQLGDLSTDKVVDVSAVAEATRHALRGLPPPVLAPIAGAQYGRLRADLRDSHAPQPPRRRAMSAYRLDQFVGYLLSGDLGTENPDTGLARIATALPSPEQAVAQILHRLDSAPMAQRRAAIMRLLAVATQPVLSALAALLVGREPEGEASATASRSAARAVARAISGGGASSLADPAEAVIAALWPYQPGCTPGADPAKDAREPAEELQIADCPVKQAPNAGVVLLHAFLPQLFEKLGIVGDTGFRSDAAHVGAVRLIHYLATGMTTAEEPLLVVPKLLCGLGPEVPVLTPAPLDAAWLQLADDMLEAIIGHWKKLGNASPEGLRETFLTRPGVIKGLPGRPQLIVERKGVDVLLGSMPWALSPVRLPWLNRPIPVDWG